MSVVPTHHSYLVGGKITAVTEEPFDGGYGLVTCIEVTFPRTKQIRTLGYEGPAKGVKLQVWQDEEGNGPVSSCSSRPSP